MALKFDCIGCTASIIGSDLEGWEKTMSNIKNECGKVITLGMDIGIRQKLKDCLNETVIKLG